MSDIISDGVGATIIFFVVALGLICFAGRPVLSVLAAVFGALDNFGA